MTPETLAFVGQFVSLAGDFITRVGFPIAVSVFLLWRMDRTIREIRDTMISIRDFLAEIR